MSAHAGDSVAEAIMENFKTEPNAYTEMASATSVLDLPMFEKSGSIEIRPTNESYKVGSNFKLTYDIPASGILKNLFLVVQTSTVPFAGAATATFTGNCWKLIDNIEWRAAGKTFLQYSDFESMMKAYLELSVDERDNLLRINDNYFGLGGSANLITTEYTLALPLIIPGYSPATKGNQFCLDSFENSGKLTVDITFKPSDFFTTTGAVTNDAPFESLYLVGNVCELDTESRLEAQAARWSQLSPVVDYTVITDTFQTTTAATTQTFDLNSLKNLNIQAIHFMLIEDAEWADDNACFNFYDLMNLATATERISSFKLTESGKIIRDQTTNALYGVLENYDTVKSFNSYRNERITDIYIGDDELYSDPDMIGIYLQTSTFKNLQLRVNFENLSIGTDLRYFVIARNVKNMYIDKGGKVNVEN